MIENSFYYIKQKDIKIEDVKNILDFNLRLKLSNESEERINSSRKFLEDKIKDDTNLYYGINTGFGSLCNYPISNGDLKKLQLNLVRSHACGSGDEIDPLLVKIMLLLKIKSLSLGFSGIKRETIERLIFFFNEDILPVIYESGSLGASGDLAPLAHLSLPLIGEGYVNYNGERQKTKDLLKQFDLSPIELGAKEGLALLNGTQFMSSHAVWAAITMNRVFDWVNYVSALSLDAFNCGLSPFDKNVHELRPYVGQKRIAKTISEILHNSDLHSVENKDVQDPYSFRCIPQVHGASLDSFEDFVSKTIIEINSVTDNPIIIKDQNKIISAGNFHGQPLALSMDFMSIATAELGSISERRIYKLISGTRGLPEFLIKDPGLNSGFMIPQYTAASLVSKNKVLCHPASIDSIDSSNGQEDHVSMGSIAGVKLMSIIKNIERILSIELLVAAQAFDFRKSRTSSPFIDLLLKDFRKVVSFLENDQVMHELMERSLCFLQNHELKKS